MKKIYALIYVMLVFTCTNQVIAQTAFVNSNSRLNTSSFHSGVTVAIADFNNDGLDDIIRLDQGYIAYVEIQRTGNNYETRYLGTFDPNSAWGMCVADVDKNGYLDVLAGGYSAAVQILMTNSTGTGGTIIGLPNSNFFLQNATFGDFNNDGWIDVFLCDDNAESHIYLNDLAGNLVPSATTINFDVTPTDDSGNYGSVWTDFDNDGDLDLYIAKCRQGVNSPTDGRRIDVLFENNGNGTFTENAAAHGLANGWQTWTASFGDLDNDGDLDLLATNHDHESQIFRNDGNFFTDITSTTGFDITDITPIQSVMEDFDNDGYNDLFITGSDSRFYHNNGNMTFTKVDNLFNSDNMESFAIGDLNHDGFIDIYGSYATIYTNPSTIDDVIWMNKRNANNFITFNLKGVTSNKDAIGARAFIYGAWGTQVREARAGESYGAVNTPMLHFGLGQYTSIDSVIVRWPSGTTQTIVNPAINQFVTIIEGDCVSPQATITYPGNPIICTGQSFTFGTTPGTTYTNLWSDGSTNATLTVNTGGEYGVVISEAGNNCVAISPTVELLVSPDETPTITTTQETNFCQGGSVLIEGPANALSYLWSNGDTTQNITVTQSGNYELTIQGTCQQYTSTPIPVTVFTVPDAVASNVSISGPGSATLTATGTNISWYDAQTGGALLGTGSTFVTPAITTTTDFWVQNSETFGNATIPTGLPYAFGTNVYSGNTSNGVTSFDVTKNCNLKSVKVYTDLVGTRRIELKDNAGTVLQFADVLISPDTQVVNLNFALTPGTNYTLSTNGTVNQAIPGWGNVSPRLKRNSVGVAYPYTVTDALSITGSNFGGSYYYYFFDWQVEKEGITCESALVPVTVTVTSVGLNELAAKGIQIYPNPVNDFINIKFENNARALAQLLDATGRLVISQQLNDLNNSIPVSGLAAGVYQLQLTKDGVNYQQRIVVQ